MAYFLFSQRTKLEAMESSAFFYLKSLVGPDLSCHLGFHPCITCAESFLLAQSTVTAPLKYDLRSLDLIQFHLQRLYFSQCRRSS